MVFLGNSVQRLAIWSALILAFAGPSGLQLFFLLTAAVTGLFRPRVAGWFWAVLAPYAHCRACGHAMPLVARWKCSCGYLPPASRHVFSRCRLCAKGFRWVVCPACDGSILL